MARIVLADDGIAFDGTTPLSRPLGGAESAVISLLEALAARGHQVEGRTMCTAPVDHAGVHWHPITAGLPDTADLYIANRGDRLIRAMPGARRTVFWIHNPARYLLKPRYMWKLALARPAIVFLGPYHLATYPAWAPGGPRVAIPHGLPELFRTATPPDDAPEPRAIFTSNPLRGLDWLLDLWAAKIQPRVPQAELHVFSGPATYGAAGEAKARAMSAILDKARALQGRGVMVRAPVPKAELLQELLAARVLLYRGDENETFCLAVGEAQAAGVPVVVQPIGSVPERVRDGLTGVVAADDTAFADAAVRLLASEETWRTMHINALKLQRGWSWDDAARAFEGLLP